MRTKDALVKQDEGIVMLDQGVVATAQVNLNWCRITSPIDGRAGVRLVDPGNYVTTGAHDQHARAATTGSTTSPVGIVIVNQIEPIAVTFSVPQGDYQRLSEVSNGFRKPLATEALSQDTGASLGTGELSIADNRVDPTTGTVKLKARFANTERSSVPGQFVNVQLTLQTLPNATTIPDGGGEPRTERHLRLCGRGQPDSVDAADQGRRDRGHDGGDHQRPHARTDRGHRRTDDLDRGLDGQGHRVGINDARKPTRATGPASSTGPSPPNRVLPAHPSPGSQVSLSSPFIHRPVATTLIAIAFLLVGIVGYLSLPVAALPQRGFPDRPGQRQRCPGPAPRPWPPTSPRRSSGSSR